MFLLYLQEKDYIWCEMSTFPLIMKGGCLVFNIRFCPVKTTITIHCAVLVTLAYFTFQCLYCVVFTAKHKNTNFGLK